MSFKYTDVQYCEMVRMLARCGDSVNLAVRQFKEEFGVSMSRRTMFAATQRLRDHGTFRPPNADKGAQRYHPDFEDEILNYFDDNPTASRRQAGRLFNCSNFYVSTVLKRNGRQPKAADFNDREATSAPEQCEPVEELIENVEVLACAECDVEIDGCEMYRCVQCPLVVMCAKCGRDNAHAHHCVLRIPSLLVYNKMKDLFEYLGDVFNKKLCDDDKDGATAKVKKGSHDKEGRATPKVNSARHDDKGRATDKVKRGRRKQSGAPDVNIIQTRTEAVAGPSLEPPAVAAETSGEPLIYLPEVKPEPDPDPLSCPLDPHPLTLSALDTLSVPHQSRPEKRKTPKTTTPQIKKPRKKAIAETIVSVEQGEVVVEDVKVEIEVEEHELQQTDEVEVKQEPPEQDSFVFYASHPASRSDFGI